MNYKKILAVVNALILTCGNAAVPTANIISSQMVYAAENADAAVIAEGKLGENISYTIDDSGEMAVTGFGEMEKTIENAEGIESVTSLVISPESGKTMTICDSAFAGMKNLSEVKLSDGIESIGPLAFAYCIKITEVTIPDTVTELGDKAFYGCRALKTAKIGSGVIDVSEELFGECYNLTHLTMPVLKTLYTGSTSEDIVVKTSVRNLFTSDQNELDRYSISEITITEGTTVIPAYEFCGMLWLTKINIPETVKSIEEGAFSWCERLKEITIPESVEKIGNGAFCACTSLESIKLPGELKSIGNEAFYGCNKITEVIIPDTVTELGEKAFAECSRLEAARIGKGVTKVSRGLFAECYDLAYLAMPVLMTSYTGTEEENVEVLESVRHLFTEEPEQIARYQLSEIEITEGAVSIPDYEFCLLSQLKKVTMPETVETIGNGAFAGCLGITEINIPKKTEKIGNAAFYYCNSLSDIYYSGTEEEWNSIEGAPSGDSITVHYNSVLPGHDETGMTKEEAEKLRGCGDIDSSGIVDITDLSYLALYNIHDMEFSENQLIFADVETDGAVNLADLARLKMILSHSV